MCVCTPVVRGRILVMRARGLGGTADTCPPPSPKPFLNRLPGAAPALLALLVRKGAPVTKYSVEALNPKPDTHHPTQASEHGYKMPQGFGHAGF